MKKQFFLVLFILMLGSTLGHSQINAGFQFDGQNRSYIVYTPASYNPSTPVPLVFVLHGFTQSGQSIMNVSAFNSVADTANFIIVYPNGISNAWNTYANIPGASTANDIGFIEALIDTISANYSIDQNRIYSCGFSAGGFMSHLLACKSSRCFAAIASVAGTMTDSVYNSCAPSYNVSVLQIHGTSDNIVNYNGALGNKSATDVVDLWKNFHGCSLTPVVTALPNTNLNDNSTVDLLDYAPCSNNNMVQMLRVNGGGHQWPGTSSLLGGLGTINRDIKASGEIWNFFRSNSCNSSTQGLNTSNPEWINLQPLSANNYLLNGSVSNAVIQVYSANGQLIETQNLSLPNTIDFNNYQSGMYLINIRSGNFQNTFKINKH
jgi:polyhydroxybutyrate depolymerase